MYVDGAEIDRASDFRLTQQLKDIIKTLPFPHSCIDFHSVGFILRLSKSLPKFQDSYPHTMPSRKIEIVSRSQLFFPSHLPISIHVLLPQITHF